MKKLGIWGIFFSICLFFMQESGAQETVGFGAEDLRIGKIAREKSYPGGQDEEDLEVQTQIVKPIRKEEIKKENIESPVSNDDEF